MSLKTMLSGDSTSVPYRLQSVTKTSLRDRFFSSVGVPVHTLRPDQNIPVLRLALQSANVTFEDDYDLLRKAAPLFQEEFARHVRKITHKDAAEIMYRSQPKQLSRMRDKENAAGEGATCAASHTDLNAVMIFAKDIQAFQRLTDRLRPANNSHVAQLKEKSVNPDESFFPGNTVKYIVERNIGGIKNVPMVCEIIILMDGCQKYYRDTHDKQELNRGMNKWWKDWFDAPHRGHSDVEVVAALAKIEAKNSRSLPKVNRDMAKATGMDLIYQQREYHFVDGMPVTHVRNKLGENFCFAPNPNTGFYERADQFLGKISPQTKSSREEFLILSQDLVPAPDIKRLSGRLPDASPQLVNKIA